MHCEIITGLTSLKIKEKKKKRKDQATEILNSLFKRPIPRQHRALAFRNEIRQRQPDKYLPV